MNNTYIFTLHYLFYSLFDLCIARVKQGTIEEFKNIALQFCNSAMQLMEILFSFFTKYNLVKLSVTCCPCRQIKMEILCQISGKLF